MEGATNSTCFRVFFLSTVLLGALVVSSQIVPMVWLNVIIQMLNGALMPLVVGIVFYLASRPGILPEQHRVKGARALITVVPILVCAVGALRLARDCLFGGVALQ